MLRQRTQDGWYLIRHPDHARLAGDLARVWGNSRFQSPEPRDDVLYGIACHDDGWAVRDRLPFLTRSGSPSAFGVDLVGKYTAFEEIDLADYLAVRGQALETVAVQNPYAAILVSMHTCNLLSERADRSTLRPEDLPLLDDFVDRQRERQLQLLAICAASGKYPPAALSPARLHEHFCLLQACDNLSLLACVDFDGPASLLHPLPTSDGAFQSVEVIRTGPRRFRLIPHPLRDPVHTFSVPAHRVAGLTFARVEDLQAQFAANPEELLTVEITA